MLLHVRGKYSKQLTQVCIVPQLSQGMRCHLADLPSTRVCPSREIDGHR